MSRNATETSLAGRQGAASRGLLSVFNGTIKARLITLIGMLAVALLAVGAVGLVTADNSNGRLRTVYEDRAVPLGQIAEINDRMSSNIMALYQAASDGIAGGEVDVEATRQLVEANIAAITEVWGLYMGTYLTPEEAELAERYQTARRAFVEEGLRPALDQVASRSFRELDAFVTGTVVPLFAVAKPLAEDLVALQIDVAAQEFESATSEFTVAFMVAIGLLLGGLVVSVVMGMSTIAAIVRPLGRLIGAMGEIAQGNYDNRIEVVRRDELGQALEHLGEMQAKLHENREAERRAAREKEERASRLDAMTASFEGEVSSMLKTVAAASTELQGTATSMTATAEETTHQSMAVASAAEQAGANVQTVASAAEELSGSIAEISNQVSQSTTVASKAQSEAEQANTNVRGLATAAKQIGDVVTLINDIAARTNLLALNATIEAARAGEAGKGFAVVASEVKSLASQTAKATEEISTQIAAIQSATGQSVQAIEGIGEVVAEVNQITTMIASAVEQQRAATAEIARNVQQAATGTTEVTENISSVREAAGHTGAAASQVLASSTELSEQAERLRSEVERFLADVKAA